MIVEEEPTIEVPLAQRNLQRNNHSNNERNNNGDDRQDEDMRDTSSPEPTALPWYSRTGLSHYFGQRQVQAQATSTPATQMMLGSAIRPIVRRVSRDSTGNNEPADSREDEDILLEPRDGGSEDYGNKSRIHEPLKRYHRQENNIHYPQQQQSQQSQQSQQQPQPHHSSYNSMGIIPEEQQQEQQHTSGRSTKRRRVGDYDKTIRMGFYRAIPAMTERQQAMMEYTAPSTLTPMFYWLGYTPFAISWVVFMYLVHTIQTLVSNFGPETKSWRVKPWIGPLMHLVLDAYVWNNSLITFMLLRPEWFGDSAYWVAVLGFIWPQQATLAMSLKTHYVHHKSQSQLLDEKKCYQMELRLMDVFFLYASADVLFILAKLFSLPYLLWLGLVVFNAAPLYLIGSHKLRVDDATISPTSKNAIVATTDDDDGASDSTDIKEAKKDK